MKKFICMITSIATLSACHVQEEKPASSPDTFNYNVEEFADIGILRYQVEGFESLPLQQKKMIYYLSQAAVAGRDIFFDQNGKWNLAIRRTLEAIYEHYNGDRNSESFQALEQYLKQVWFASGIHHHYSMDKFKPGFSTPFFAEAVQSIDSSLLPLKAGESKEELIEKLTPVIFDPTVDAKRVNQAAGEDLILTSACNYYDGVTQQEAETFYNNLKDLNDQTPVSYGLNSRLVKKDGKIEELVWKTDGLYGEALTEVVYWLEKALSVAENDAQRAYIEKLIDFNRTGDLKTFDQYAILWVKDTISDIDFVNGFTESYGDPLGMKASWESVVNFKNKEASKRTETISENAQWFEDHSPVDSRFKKETVKGVSAKVITAAMLGGDCYPATPIGINLPNSNWIRRDHGSKSVTIENITKAYDMASLGNGFNEEFVWSDTERELLKKYGFTSDNMHTDLHECLGHGSGKLLPGVDPDALKAYGSTLEEARADLFALYYIADPKLVELGLLPDQDAYKAEYYRYIMNGLMTQLTRIEPGKSIEESHMRNRQLIAKWLFEKGEPEKVIELKKRDGKSFVVINHYDKMRTLVGQLLAEVQRIKSEGDYEAGKNLVETYGVRVDTDLHKEVLDRYAHLQIKPYKGFVNPVYTPVTDDKGEITDILISYDEGYAQQMLRYSKEFNALPTYNN